MKSDEEFLTGMWSIVDEAEREARLIAAAKAEHKKLVAAGIRIYTAVIACIAAVQISVLAGNEFLSENIFFASFALLVFGYIADVFIYSRPKTSAKLHSSFRS